MQEYNKVLSQVLFSYRRVDVQKFRRQNHFYTSEQRQEIELDF